MHWSCPVAIVFAVADVYGFPTRADTLAVLSSEQASKFAPPELFEELPGEPDAALVVPGDPGLVDPEPVDAELLDEEPPHAARPRTKRQTATPSGRACRSDLKCIGSIRFVGWCFDVGDADHRPRRSQNDRKVIPTAHERKRAPWPVASIGPRCGPSTVSYSTVRRQRVGVN
jgi:hypothetical protein